MGKGHGGSERRLAAGPFDWEVLGPDEVPSHRFPLWQGATLRPINNNSLTGVNLSSGVAEYAVVATIMHHGEEVSSGHYTAQLVEADGEVLCDDNVAPTYHGRPGIGGTKLIKPISLAMCISWFAS